MPSEPQLNPETDSLERDESEASEHLLEQPVIAPEPEVVEEVKPAEEENKMVEEKPDQNNGASGSDEYDHETSEPDDS